MAENSKDPFTATFMDPMCCGKNHLVQNIDLIEKKYSKHFDNIIIN